MQREVPISARQGLAALQLDDSMQPAKRRPNPNFDADSATAEMLLREVRCDAFSWNLPRSCPEASLTPLLAVEYSQVRAHEPTHHIPDDHRHQRENRELYVLLENMKEMALQVTQ